MSISTSTTSHLTTGGDGTVRLTERSLRAPGADEVRIRIAAASVNPADYLTRDGLFHQMGRAEGEIGLGWDLAGTIEAVGDNVRDFAPGDQVIAIRDDPASPEGAHGEAVVVPVRAVGRAPEGVEMPAAATLPLNALTAWQALDLLDLPAGAAVLVTGAAGAVGGFAVELAKQRGLRVVAQAGGADAEWLRTIGADEVIGRDDHVERTVDGALDAASIGTAAIAQVRDGGSFVGVLDPTTPEAERGITVSTVHVRAEAGQLDEISRLADRGKLTLRVAETVPLREADRAYARVQQGGLRGRVVLVA